VIAEELGEFDRRADLALARPLKNVVLLQLAAERQLAALRGDGFDWG